jgi:hypothetical protein
MRVAISRPNVKQKVEQYSRCCVLIFQSYFLSFAVLISKLSSRDYRDWMAQREMDVYEESKALILITDEEKFRRRTYAKGNANLSLLLNRSLHEARQAVRNCVTVDSELSCPVLVAHHMSASSASVLLWACGRGVSVVHMSTGSPPSGFKRRFSHA